MADDIQTRIADLVKSNKIVLFMKGTPSMPMCGFSQQAAYVLSSLDKPFEHVDVIGNPEYRQAIKTYSSWPTIPQVYIGGEFLGGSDILRQMFESGELDKMVVELFGE